MKKFTILLLILLVTLMSGLSSQVWAEKTQAVIVAKGLVCEFCAKALEKVLLKRPEVEGISVDLSSKEIRVTFQDGQTIDDDELTSLIIDAGYNVESIKRQGGL